MTADETVPNCCCSHAIATRPFREVTAASYCDDVFAGGGWTWSVERMVPSVLRRHSLIPDLPAVTTMKSLPVDVTAYDSLPKSGNANRVTKRPSRSYTEPSIPSV